MRPDREGGELRRPAPDALVGREEPRCLFVGEGCELVVGELPLSNAAARRFRVSALAWLRRKRLRAETLSL
jgi:hypothetical protein